MKSSFYFLISILLFTSCLKNDFPVDLRISSLSSLSGSAFTVITIHGSNFKADPLLDTVKINGVVATVQSATTSSITFIVPFCNGSGNITISTPDATVTGPYFNYIKGPDVYVSGWGDASTTNFKTGIVIVEKSLSNEKEKSITTAICKKLLATNIVANSFFGLDNN